jgi:hypothetical protein
MSSLFAIFFRANQFIWIILVTALIGNVLASKNEKNSAVNYAMFAAAFAWVAWFYGIAAVLFDRIAIPLLVLILDVLAMIFTFVAAIVIPAKLDGVHSCSNQVRSSCPRSANSHLHQAFCLLFSSLLSFFISLFPTFPTPTPANASQFYVDNNSIIRGGNNRSKRCRELQASTAFFWFLWACFIGSVVLTSIQISSNGLDSGSMSYRGRASSRSRSQGHREAPAMSQV